MNSDFRNSEVGDWAFGTRLGWKMIVEIQPEQEYPIIIDGGETFTLDGKFRKSDAAAMLFVEPPSCFNVGPKPSNFTKGQKVLVRDEQEDGDEIGWERAYFSHMEGDEFHTFAYGADEWSNEGNPTIGWGYCKSWEE